MATSTKTAKRLSSDRDPSVDAAEEPRKLYASSRLLGKIRERKKVASLFSAESVKQRDEKNQLKNLPRFYDQVFFHMRARKSNSLLLNELSESLADKSNTLMSQKTAEESLRWLSELLPEWCSISPNDMFTVKGAKRLQLSRTELREKLVERSRRKLDDLCAA